MTALYDVVRQIVGESPILLDGVDWNPILCGIVSGAILVVTVFSVFRFLGVLLKK